MARKYPSDPIAHAKTMRKEPIVRAEFPCNASRRALGKSDLFWVGDRDKRSARQRQTAQGKAGYFACSGFFISRNQASALPGRTRASLLKKSSANTRSSPEVQPS